MKRLFLSLISLSFIFNVVMAESTVYVIQRDDAGGSELKFDLSIDGNKIGSLLGSLKKMYPPVAGATYLPTSIYNPAIKKCVLNNEGKTLFRVDTWMKYAVNPSQIIEGYAEIQLDIEDGKTYYLTLKAKGLKDMELIEISEDIGLKELKNKKYDFLPEWIQPEE